jgi:prepilin-type N-terminal cleavage/methylation domain-containing protein
MRRLRQVRREDRGISLAEMLIAMSIASIIMLAIGTLFVSSLRQNRTVSGKTTSTSDARIAMEAMTRALRVASIPPGKPAALITATTTSLSFYSSLGTSTATNDPKPSLVTFTVDTTRRCLWREVTPATVVGTTWSWPTTSKKSGCVARGDFNTDGTPVFTYFPLAADDTVSTTAYAQSAVAANLGNVASVGLAVEVGDTRYPAVGPSTLQDQVTLINVATALAG